MSGAYYSKHTPHPSEGAKDMALTIRQSDDVNKCRGLLFETGVNIAGMGWFEVVLRTERIMNQRPDLRTDRDAPDLYELIELGFQSPYFTETETQWAEKALLEAGTYWNTDIFQSRVPLRTEYVHAMSPERKLDLAYVRLRELSIDELYEALPLMGFAYHILYYPNLDNVDPVRIIDAASTGEVPTGVVFYDVLSWWHDYILDAIPVLRERLDVGDDVPDEWVIQAGFKHPEAVNILLASV